MLMRYGLLGLITLIALVGQASAAPPLNPQVDGREMDLVAREYHQAEKSAERNSIGPTIPSPSKGERVETELGWNTFRTAVWEYVQRHIVNR
jgi:hypothetical protein